MDKRCAWAEKNELDQVYHDNEWGRPIYDDKKLFETLILESMQAGLSWSTILSKRESLTRAYDGWDYNKIANYDDKKMAQLLEDPGVIRNKLKIKSVKANAQAFINIQKEFHSFSDYIWNYVNKEPLKNSWATVEEVPAFTELSDIISKDLKKRGFKFLGTTTVYAFMQASGLVNDHVITCFCYEETN